MTETEQEMFLYENTFDFFIVRKDSGDEKTLCKGLKRDWVYFDVTIDSNKMQYEGCLEKGIELLKVLLNE